MRDSSPVQRTMLALLTGILMAYGVGMQLPAAQAFEEEPKVYQLWPEDPPGPKSFAEGEERDLQKESDPLVGGKTVMKLGHVNKPEMHVYLPAPDKANGSACVICPGGGFSILAWDLEGVEVANWLNQIGMAAIVVKYRVPTRQHQGDDRWRGPVMDTQRAISLVRKNAAEWKIDPDRVGVLGFSAGGATAARAALLLDERLYEAIDDSDQLTCQPNFSVLIYTAYLVDEAGELLAELPVSEASPPTFFVHAADDPVTCLSSVELFAALKKNNVDAELHIYGAGGHGYGLRPTDQSVTHWPDLAEKWFAQLGILDDNDR